MSKTRIIAAALLLSLMQISLAEAQQARPRLLIPDGAAPPQATATAPQAGTIWHKLGVPQGMERLRKFRDSRINRDGNNPLAERKPQLKPIAHEDFLQDDAPELLKAAAKAKQDNDLAPQKIKALKYIASLGCGCSKQDFEDALLAGLEDCVAEVREEAVRTIIATASQGSCGTEACPERRLGQKLGKHGHRQNCCPDTGVVMHFSDCLPMAGCAACGACCSYKIQEKLKEMAFKMDEDNCFVEPSPTVRALAEQALGLCPVREAPVVPTPPVPIPTPIEGGGSEEDEENGERVGRAQQLPHFSVVQPPRQGTPAQPTSTRGQVQIGASSAPTPIIGTAIATPPSVFAPADRDIDVPEDDYLLDCQVASHNGSDRLMIRFSREYTLPSHGLALAIDSAGQQQLCQIVHTQAGQAILKPVDKSTFDLARTGNLKLGVLEQ